MSLSSSGLDWYHPIAQCSMHCTLKKMVLDDCRWFPNNDRMSKYPKVRNSQPLRYQYAFLPSDVGTAYPSRILACQRIPGSSSNSTDLNACRASQHSTEFRRLRYRLRNGWFKYLAIEESSMPRNRGHTEPCATPMGVDKCIAKTHLAQADVSMRGCRINAISKRVCGCCLEH